MTAETETPVTWRKKSVTSTHFVIAAAGLVCFLLWLNQVTTAPPPPQETPISRYYTRKIKQLAREAQGDYRRLKPEDRKWLDTWTTSHTDEVIRYLYNHPEFRPED